MSQKMFFSKAKLEDGRMEDFARYQLRPNKIKSQQSWKENSRKSGQQSILNNNLQKSNQFVDKSKNSSRINVISLKIGSRKHQLRRKHLEGSNLLSRKC